MNRIAMTGLILSGGIIALAPFVPWKQLAAHGVVRKYHIIQVAPTTFTETKSFGSPVVHKILQAKIQTSTDSNTEDLEIYAKNFFNGDLKHKADEQQIEMVWITFYFADTPDQMSGMVRTFRDIYIRDNGNWQRFQKPTGQRT